MRRFAVVFVIAVIFSAYFWSTRAGSRESRTDLSGVRTAVAGFGSVQSTIRTSGSVAAQKSVTLTAPRILGSRTGFNRGGDTNFSTPGSAGAAGLGGADFNLTLLSIAKPGSHVHAGEVVAQFDTQNQLQRLDDYRDSVVQMDNALRNLRAGIAAAMEAFTQQVRSADADRRKAVLDLQTAPVRSDIDIEKDKLTVEETEAAYKALNEQIALLDDSQKAQIRAAELTLDQARLEFQRAEANVRRMTILAPIDGIVVMASIVRNGEFGQIREGDQVNAGQPFVSIIDPASMALNASVNQVDAERLRLGMRAVVRVDAYPDIEMRGTVIGIGAMSRASTFRGLYVGELPLRVQIDGGDPRLIPDLTGSAEVVVGAEAAAVTIPRDAVFAENGSTFVYCRGAEGWTKKPVEVGIMSATQVTVRQGLEAGTVVALTTPR